MTYRRQIEFAVGHGVGIHAEKRPNEWERACRRSAPASCHAYEVEQVEAPTPGAWMASKLDMQVLSQLSGEQFETALGPLLRLRRVDRPRRNPLAPARPRPATLRSMAVAAALDACRATLGRIRDGLDLLQNQ